jgi:hypothetical protein
LTLCDCHFEDLGWLQLAQAQYSSSYLNTPREANVEVLYSTELMLSNPTAPGHFSGGKKASLSANISKIIVMAEDF